MTKQTMFLGLLVLGRALKDLRVLLTVVLLAVSTTMPAYADNWVSVTGADRLHELVAGTTAEIELKDGVTAIGVYRADGTATMEAWGQTFLRTWEVIGDDQVCYSPVAAPGTECFTFEENLDAPGEYRIRHTETGEMTVVRIIGTDPKIASRDEVPDSDGGLGSPSVEEIAAQLSNPNNTMGTMSTQFDYIAFDGDLPGASSQSGFRAIFQPSLPYSLRPGMNLFVRPAIPIIFSQDVPAAGGFDSKGINLGDISFDASLAQGFPSGLVLIAGLVGTIPTATDDALGLNQWLLGPEVAIAKVQKWGVVGLLVTHQWDVAGDDSFSTSITAGQYFYAINLSNGWQINGAPTFSYNHNADSDNNFTFPLGVGVSKTTLIGVRPWKFGVQYWHYLASPDLFGPDWQIRLSVSPVVKLPW
ncbi:MAG: hypothetical protein O7E57_03240 [Gammaproteobacteria bacterium]|nr:hypothetical protein [Gammaproteobacteria bacterium]